MVFHYGVPLPSDAVRALVCKHNGGWQGHRTLPHTQLPNYAFSTPVAWVIGKLLIDNHTLTTH